MKEIDVVRRTKAFLYKNGLFGAKISELYTDAHPSLLIDRSLEPFQRFILQFDNFSVHPDLVGRLENGGVAFAIEAKGEDDWLKGIAQADIYKQAFHCSIFACAGTPSEDMIAIARQRGVGIIAVNMEAADLIERPLINLPQLRYAESIQKQFPTTNALIKQFYFNLPTHYISCASCLMVWNSVFLTDKAIVKELEVFVRILYPEMPEGFRSALSGAEKLGLVSIKGETVMLTRLGSACTEILPSPIELSKLHKQSKKRQKLDTNSIFLSEIC